MISFVSAGPGDPELITLKGLKALQKADFVLFTGSLVPKELLKWSNPNAIIKNSYKMSYEEIFEIFKENRNKNLVRLQTGDVTLYSTLAKQIEFLEKEKIEYEIIPGVSAAFGASSACKIEYTIPGISQTLILTRVEGKTPNPEPLENILRCQNSSLVFYLSITLIDELIKKALEMGYPKNTPCWVVEKASWPEEKIYKGDLETISKKVSSIKGVALILLGEFLRQKEKLPSYLYSQKWS